MKFAIRDDDICYFTQPVDLESTYGATWEQIPISLAIIPFQISTKCSRIPEKFWGEDIEFPLAENKELVAFLREKVREGKICIMLHGYSHETRNGEYEFVAGTNLYAKVRKGKHYLEKLFDVQITSFVPPYNHLSKEGLKAVVANGLNIVGCFSTSLRVKFFAFQNVSAYLQRLYSVLTTRRRYYPYVLRVADHCELPSTRLAPSTTLESLLDSFDFVRNCNGHFCLATHHWELNSSKIMKQNLQKFLDYTARFQNVHYLTIDEIFREHGCLPGVS